MGYALALVASAALAIGMPNVCTLYWTNPPDQDIHKIEFYACRWDCPLDSVLVGTYWGRNNHLLPGQRDSLHVALPCRSDTVTVKFWCFAWDTTGRNRSQKSNVTSWLHRGGTK